MKERRDARTRVLEKATCRLSPVPVGSRLGCLLFLRVEAHGPHPVAFLRRIGGWRNEPLRVAAPRLTKGGGAELEPWLLGALVGLGLGLRLGLGLGLRLGLGLGLGLGLALGLELEG